MRYSVGYEQPFRRDRIWCGLAVIDRMQRLNHTENIKADGQRTGAFQKFAWFAVK